MAPTGRRPNSPFCLSYETHVCQKLIWDCLAMIFLLWYSKITSQRVEFSFQSLYFHVSHIQWKIFFSWSPKHRNRTVTFRNKLTTSCEKSRCHFWHRFWIKGSKTRGQYGTHGPAIMPRTSTPTGEWQRVKPCNLHIAKTLELVEAMICLADQGDTDREDNGCGILYGILRDSAYKLKKLAEEEKQNHIRKGWWPEDGMNIEKWRIKN